MWSLAGLMDLKGPSTEARMPGVEPGADYSRPGFGTMLLPQALQRGLRCSGEPPCIPTGVPVYTHQTLGQELACGPGFLIVPGEQAVPQVVLGGPSPRLVLIRDLGYPTPMGSVPRALSTWHGDLGKCLRLAQRVNLDVSEGLAHGALQVPASQEHRLVQEGVLEMGMRGALGMGPGLVLLPGRETVTL